MKRLLAVWRCFFYGLMPWWVELVWRGYVHYVPRNFNYNQWVDLTRRNLIHGYFNMLSAWELLTFQPLSEDDRRFHKL